MNNSNLVDLYLRLSVDREGKDSMERQERDLRAWAARENLTVRHVWRDAGKSGYRAGVQRPDFDAAVKAVKGGEVGTLAVWKLDRLSRRGAGQVGLVLDDVEAVGGRLFFLKDSLDSTVPGHRMVIVVVSEQARAESANTAIRVRAKKEEQRKAGQYLGGSRPFGYIVTDERKLRRHAEEAPLIRELVDRTLRGETLLTVARDWNVRGIPTRRGATHWRSSTLSAVLRSPALSGLVPDHTEKTAGYQGLDIHPWRHPDTGETVSLMAAGEAAIVSEAERQRLLTVLDGRLRRYGRGLRSGRQPSALLSGGLVHCATCGRTAVSFGYSYRCRRRDFVGDDCAHPLSVQTRTLEPAVMRAWSQGLAAMEPDDPRLRIVADRWLAEANPVPIRERERLAVERDEVAARVDAADTDHYVRGTLSADRHARITSALEARIRRIDEDLAALPRPEADFAPLLDPERSLPAITAAEVPEARRLLRLAITRVDVTPAPKAGARFVAPERMRLTWVGEEADEAASERPDAVGSLDSAA